MHNRLKEKIPATGSGIKPNHQSDFLWRWCEVSLAIGGLLVLLPVLLLCALLVRWSSPGSIFFRQRRVGRKGKTFTLYKFRTMFEANGGLPITAEGDNRITRIGKILRKTKLDELPQLFNILRGEMSFVGPRPEVVELVDLNNPLWEKVLSVRPGITDPITLQFRNEESLLAEVDDKAKFYLEVIQPYKLNGYSHYIESKSLIFDLKIIGQTFKVILFPNTALLGIEEIKFPALSEDHFVGK